MPVFSLDHEFLTRDGWKYKISPVDELATITTTNAIQYLTPALVKQYPYDGPMVFLETPRMNLLVAPDTVLYDSIPISHACDGNIQEPTFVFSDHKRPVDTLVCHDRRDADAIMIDAIMNGHHATLQKNKDFLINPTYTVSLFDTDPIIDPAQHDCDLVHIPSTKGGYVIELQMPIQARAICTRRYGKPSWVQSSV